MGGGKRISIHGRMIFLSGGADQSEEYLLNNNMMLVAAVVRRVQCAVLQCAVEC